MIKRIDATVRNLLDELTYECGQRQIQLEEIAAHAARIQALTGALDALRLLREHYRAEAVPGLDL